MDKAKVNFLCEERADTADLDREIERLHLRLRLDEIRKQQRNENNEDMKEEQKALDYTNRWTRNPRQLPFLKSLRRRNLKNLAKEDQAQPRRRRKLLRRRKGRTSPSRRVSTRRCSFTA